MVQSSANSLYSITTTLGPRDDNHVKLELLLKVINVPKELLVKKLYQNMIEGMLMNISEFSLEMTHYLLINTADKQATGWWMDQRTDQQTQTPIHPSCQVLEV